MFIIYKYKKNEKNEKKYNFIMYKMRLLFKNIIKKFKKIFKCEKESDIYGETDFSLCSGSSISSFSNRS
jgi:hypothetical protein